MMSILHHLVFVRNLFFSNNLFVENPPICPSPRWWIYKSIRIAAKKWWARERSKTCALSRKGTANHGMDFTKRLNLGDEVHDNSTTHGSRHGYFLVWNKKLTCSDRFECYDMLWTICWDCNIWINSFLKYSVYFSYRIICKLQVSLDLFLTKHSLVKGSGVRSLEILWMPYSNKIPEIVWSSLVGLKSIQNMRADVLGRKMYRCVCINIYIYQFNKHLSAQKLSKPPQNDQQVFGVWRRGKSPQTCESSPYLM